MIVMFLIVVMVLVEWKGVTLAEFCTLPVFLSTIDDWLLILVVMVTVEWKGVT